MKGNYSISIYLDKRRAKLNGKFPLKLRVYTSNPNKQVLYPTIFDLTEKEYKQTLIDQKPSFKDLRLSINELESKAEATAKKIIPFNFLEFEKKLYRKEGSETNIDYCYNEAIKNFDKQERIGTSSSYTCSKKSFKTFIDENKLKPTFENLTFRDVTIQWLEDYEYFMTTIKEKSPTTVGIYLRSLRTVFNNSIAQKDISKEVYPFGYKKYQIPSSSATKKALSSNQLKILFNTITEHEQQQKAKDFWFFSYACNGMNIKDVALLKFKDLEDDKFHFTRAKTKRTKKKDSNKITIYLNEFSKAIIKKYSNHDTSKNNYVFSILDLKMTPLEKHTSVKTFIRFINQHVKNLCKVNGLPEDVSSYWARHSFATNSIRKGASMEFIQESLGHSDMQTTQSYFDGFDDDTKKEYSQDIMNF